MDIKVCYTSDDNYARHMAVSMASILKNASEENKLFFYILDGGISGETKEKIAKLNKIKEFYIEYVNVDVSIFKNFYLGHAHLTSAAYYRFIIADLLPGIDKIIYLDCDLIACADLKELFDTDVTDYYLAAVDDIGFFWVRRQLGRKYEEFYINSGVMVVNLQLWRKDLISKKLIEFGIEVGGKLHFEDQDIINAVLKDKIKRIDLKWNVQISFFEFNNARYHPLYQSIKQAKKNPKIIHYVSDKKPWHSYVPLKSLYLYYLGYTDFNLKHDLKNKIKITWQFCRYKLKNFIYILRYIVSPIIKGYRTDDKKIKIKIFNFFEFILCKTK
ncbi:MAG: glycosyltransferase family 8 protein [Bacilli bacterium]|jgi:lipopolysaccharide biosynthesis glycosyltransferase|nr:glycosyltransferase family 8 protein [Bacilli bacterium]